MKKTISYLCVCTVLLLAGCARHNYPSSTSTSTTTTPSTDVTAVKWVFPLPGAKVISPYGPRHGRQHTGVDLKTKNKDQILAVSDGEVIWSKPMSGYGNLVRIKHPNGLETYYAHNTKNLVKVGDKVKAGQVIALVGQSGRASTPHLHFETRVNGKPRNPTTFFDLEKQEAKAAVLKNY